MWYEKLYVQAPIKFLIRINLSLYFRFRGKFCLNNNAKLAGIEKVGAAAAPSRKRNNHHPLIIALFIYLFIFLYLTINNQIIKIFIFCKRKVWDILVVFFLFGWDKWVNDGGIDHLIWWRGSMIGNATCHLPFFLFLLPAWQR